MNPASDIHLHALRHFMNRSSTVIAPVNPCGRPCPIDISTSFPVKLKKGEVFLMGDNRPDAVDSRQFGPVNAKDTLGELMTVIRSET